VWGARNAAQRGRNRVPEITTELKIPDLWYDLYARFLPGLLFASALYLLSRGSAFLPTGWSLAALGIAGYCAGLFINPISSEIVGLLHGVISKSAVGDWDFVRKQNDFDPLRILSKMHGETTFFVQCSLLSVVLLVVQKESLFHVVSTRETVELNEVFAIIAFLMAVDVSWRRMRRAHFLAKQGRIRSRGSATRQPHGEGDL